VVKGFGERSSLSRWFLYVRSKRSMYKIKLSVGGRSEEVVTELSILLNSYKL